MNLFFVTSVVNLSNDTVNFMVGGDVVRNFSRVAPNTSTYITYDSQFIHIIQPNSERFSFSPIQITTVAGRPYTALSPLDNTDTIAQRVKDIYETLVQYVFKGCCDAATTGSCVTSYEWDSSIGAGQMYFQSGLLFASFDAYSGQDFSDFLHHLPSGSWVYLVNEASPSEYAYFEITGYSAVSGFAGWSASLISGSSTFTTGAILCTTFIPIGGGGGSQSWQQTLDVDPDVDKDNTVTGTGFDFTWSSFKNWLLTATSTIISRVTSGSNVSESGNSTTEAYIKYVKSGVDIGFYADASKARIKTVNINTATATVGMPYRLVDAATGESDYSLLSTSGIANQAVSYAKIQNVSATDKILGRSTAGAGVVEEIDCTAAGRAILDDANAAAQRTTLGATTVGSNIFTLVDPSAVSYIRMNADNSISALSAASFLAAIGGQASGSYLVTTNNLSDVSNAATSRTNLGATTLGSNVFTVTNPSAVTYFRVNADNSVTMRTASQLIADLGMIDTYVIGSGGTFNPVDSTTYYIGGAQTLGLAPTATAGARRIYAATARTIVGVALQVIVSGTNGSGESVSVYVRVNNTTDTTLTTSMTWNAGSGAYNLLNVTGLNIALAANDYFEIKIVGPAWATNPTGVVMSGTVSYQY